LGEVVEQCIQDDGQYPQSPMTLIAVYDVRVIYKLKYNYSQFLRIWEVF